MLGTSIISFYLLLFLFSGTIFLGEVTMKKKWILFIISFFILFAIDFDIYALSIGKTSDLLKLGIVGSSILFVAIYFIISRMMKVKNRAILVLSSLFSFFVVFGNSYMRVGNANLVFSNFGYFLLSVIMAIGYYFLFSYLLSFVFRYIDSGRFFREKRNITFVNRFFSEKPFRRSLLFILVAWLPYIIAFYPIILSPDPSFQIKQFFGIRTKYADYAILLDEDVVITNHHPVFHTVILGGCLKIGHTLGSDNLGLFLYSTLQILALSGVLSFTISYLKKRKIPDKYLFLMLLIYAFVPMFPLYAMSGVKDTFFTTFVILFIMLVHKVMISKCEGFKWFHYLAFIIVMLLVILFRNNGLYMIVLSFPFLILAVRSRFRELLLVFLITLSISTCYSKVLLPVLKITPGSIREVLSVPFQQTARYVKYHDEDLTLEEKNIIDTVLGYVDLASRYNPELADPVKNNYNKYTTSKELKEYFGVWFSCFFRHPVTYIDATIANVYGYFYPEKQNWYVYYKFDKRILEDGFLYHYNSLSGLRNVLSSFAVSFPSIPVIGLIANIAISVWILFTMVGYFLSKKKIRSLVFIIPSLVLILTCIVSPANTYFRYAMPYVFAILFLIGLFFDSTRNL